MFGPRLGEKGSRPVAHRAPPLPWRTITSRKGTRLPKITTHSRAALQYSLGISVHFQVVHFCRFGTLMFSLFCFLCFFFLSFHSFFLFFFDVLFLYSFLGRSKSVFLGLNCFTIRATFLSINQCFEPSRGCTLETASFLFFSFFFSFSCSFADLHRRLSSSSW